jgi:hypothetical protein
MHNKHNNIDELFKSELTGLETPAPVLVKKQIDKSLFKKYVFFFLLFIPLFALIGVLIFSNPKNNTESTLKNNIAQREENKSNQSTPIESESNFNEQLKTNNINNSSNLNAPSIVNSNQSEFQPNSTTTLESQSKKNKLVKTKNSKPTSNTNFTNSLNTDSPTKTTSQSTDELNTPNEKDLIQKKNFEVSKTAAEIKPDDLKPNLLIQSNLTETPIKTDSVKQDDIINIATTQNINQSGERSIDTKNEVKSNTINPTNVTETQIKTAKPLLVNPSGNQLITSTKDEAKLDTTNHSNETKTLIKNKSEVNDIIEKSELEEVPQTNSRNFSYLVSWTSGLNLSKSTYSSQDDNAANYYQSNHTENTNFEHNLSLNALFKNNISIGSGIGTSQQSYDYAYNEESTSTFKTLDSSIVFNTYIYASTDTLQEFAPIDSNYLTVVDTISGTLTSNTSFNGTSQAQYLHIPLQLGYVYEKNKFMFGIQLNARYNILYKTSGQSFENNTVTSFDKTNSIFKKSYFDFAVKADVYYNIFDKFYINTSFKYTPKLNNTYQNLSIERKINYLHFGLGISYKL